MISNGKKIWHTLCDECNSQIKRLSTKIKSDTREGYKIDEYHSYIIGKYGPVIKYEKDGEIKFKNVRKDIDMEKLKNGEYTLDELVQQQAFSGTTLGSYKDNDVILKKGKFGLYVNHNGKNYSLKYLNKSESEINLKDVIDIIEGKKQENKNILKVINEEMSVRKGKYGPYVYYKTSKMKKPKFIKVTKHDSIDTIDENWVNSKL